MGPPTRGVGEGEEPVGPDEGKVEPAELSVERSLTVELLKS